MKEIVIENIKIGLMICGALFIIGAIFQTIINFS